MSEGNGDTAAAPKRKLAIGFGGHRRDYLYSPLPDITTHELAELFGFLLAAMLVVSKQATPDLLDGYYDNLSENVARHLPARERSQIVVPRR
jgi:hypothetical protein